MKHSHRPRPIARLINQRESREAEYLGVYIGAFLRFSFFIFMIFCVLKFLGML